MTSLKSLQHLCAARCVDLGEVINLFSTISYLFVLKLRLKAVKKFLNVFDLFDHHQSKKSA